MIESDQAELSTQIHVRAVNEWIRDSNRSFCSGALVERFHCECGDDGCERTIGLTDREYESVRADATLFVVAPNHEHPSERVVCESRRFAVVTTIDARSCSAASSADPRHFVN